MKFEKHFPTEQLKPYIKYYVVSENTVENEYRVFPSSGLVIGFQYKGQLASIENSAIKSLGQSGITGISDGYKIFRNSADIGTILVYFTETGFSHFASNAVNELFNLSLSLDMVFDINIIREVEEKLASSGTEKQRIRTVEHFLLSQLKDKKSDKLICEAVRIIFQSKGTIRIKDLNERLFISQTPFEKRFRRVVGTTPKKFSSIVRFNSILDHLNNFKSLTDICYENNFFDQSHFIKEFRQFTGDSPQQFRNIL